jgi:hypothetical protein
MGDQVPNATWVFDPETGEMAVSMQPEAPEAVPENDSETPILAATAWPTNAQLIATVATLGYINREMYFIDMTFGRGIWWRHFKPRHGVANDLYVDPLQHMNDYQSDHWYPTRDNFLDLPYHDRSFDLVAFDPPYVAMGGRQTSTVDDMRDRFGMTTAPATPQLMQDQINGGIQEAARLLRERGILLVKMKDYISSGALWHGTTKTTLACWAAGFDVVDRLEMIGHVGPQSQRHQVHARRNLSTLLVCRKRAQ